MHRPTAMFLLATVIAATAPLALAQAEAKQAFEAGKTAFEAGELEKARQLLEKASQTDVRNPEVFLWLGKACYQLGQVDRAIAAWSRTLRLAPEQPYATKMLKALRGQVADADTRIRLIELMLEEAPFAEQLARTALVQCDKLLAEKALTDAQRAGVMALKARAQIQRADGPGAISTVRELLARFPKEADAATTTLLLGLAKTRFGGEAVAEGVALLKKVIADHAGTPAAAEAEYELIAFQLRQKPDPAVAASLEKWIAGNAGHPKARQARRRLVEAYLAVTRQVHPRTPEAALSRTDVAALAAAAQLYQQIVQAKEARSLTDHIIAHLQQQYVSSKAYAAAIAGAETLLKAALPGSSRTAVLRALARYRVEHASKVLTDQAKAGKLPAGAMPKVLADVLAVYATINKEFPAQPAWSDQATLAERVRNLAGLVPWPVKVTGPKPLHTWAVAVALPVIEANADAAAVRRAAVTVTAVVDAYVRCKGQAAKKVALAISTQLVEALWPEEPTWAASMLKQIDLLSACAANLFQENIKAGRAEDNAKLNEFQNRLLAAMSKLAARQAEHAPAVLSRLQSHLEPWLRHGHYALGEAAYEQLAGSLPKPQQQQAKLAVATLWIRQVTTEHNRLLSAGLTVPRKLDPIFAKALGRCYALQAGLVEDDPFLSQVRSVWDSIINHYTRLEYFDIAEQAVKAKPAAPAVAPADAYAQLKLAVLHDQEARRELGELLKQYKGDEKITLTPAFKTAIAEYTKFISDRPSSPLVANAVAGVFNIARLFEQHKAYDVAVGVYRDLAAFAEKVKALTQSAPGAPSAAERAKFAVAGALYAKARAALSKALAEKDPKAAPPDKISAEFAAAIAAYQGFIKANPDSGLLGQAVRQILSAALEYARIDAWDVADGIYADLLASGLPLRRPERVRFARGVCQMGKVMPDHARKVLQALTTAPPVTRRPGGADDVAALAEPSKPLSALEGTSGRLRQPTPTFKAPSLDLAWSEDRSDADGRRGRGGGGRTELEKLDYLALTAIRKDQQRRSVQVAQLRDESVRYRAVAQASAQGQKKQLVVPRPVLSEAEIARQEKALAAAYKIFQMIRKDYAATPTAEQARGEIMIMIQHWRTIGQWQRGAALGEQYLADNPTDRELPQLRLGVARDNLAWAAQPVQKQPSTQAMLAEVAQRFDKARGQLAGIVKDFPKDKSVVHQAQWDIANSFLTQARVVDAFSATLARGQYVRAATELQQVAARYHDHPNIAQIPQMLWNIAQELAGRGYYDEAINVWSELTIHYPTHPQAQQAAYRIAQTYQNNLKRPLLAAEAYLELNFTRGGDLSIQNQIFSIGVSLKNEKRWVEAMHVLESFVDGFPRNPSAGKALTMVGQIHQTNEAWDDAIKAYRRVIDEFPAGTWVRDAKWSIAECTINLSQWRGAMAAYRSYLATYAKDGKAAEANRRIGILKDLARYQALVDEEGQRKAFDAQYQIAEILLTKLSNPVKAIIEYRKVTDRWPQSHLADDAMFKTGRTYLSMGQTAKAREALLAVALKYPTSPLADDAVYMVGQSYENEAQRLAGVTREKTIKKARMWAQKDAYSKFTAARRDLRRINELEIADLKKGGKLKAAEMAQARQSVQESQFAMANVSLLGEQARQQVETLTASELADRQDKINAALRRAVGAYQQASKVPAADKADESLLRMAVIFAEKLKDSDAAMKTYLEIVRQFSGTAVAEDASWRIAQYHERQGKYAEAITAHEAFLRNYRRSPRAGAAQFAIAENYEHLGQWVKAMDAYTNYINNFPSGPLVQKATEQINWIKTYRL